MWPEKVERLISIDCRSPMSASTSSNTGSARLGAGGRRPAWCSSAARPSVFSATVLPPVFGPLITSARSVPRSRSIGTAVAGSSSGWRAASSRTSSETSTGAPRQPRERAPARDRQVDRARRLDERATSSSACVPTPRRARAGSARPPRARRSPPRRLVVQLDDLERLDEERLPRAGRVVDDARHAPRARCLDGEHGPPAALGDEVLLQVLAQRRRAREPPQLLGGALRARRELLRRRRSAGEALSRRSEPSGSTARSIRSASAGERRLDRRRQLAEQRRELAVRAFGLRGSCRRPAAASAAEARRRARRGPPPRARRDPLERRLRGGVEERDHLGGQRLPRGHLLGVGRGRERRASSSPRAVSVAAARRRAIAGNSRATVSMRRVYEPTYDVGSCRSCAQPSRSSGRTTRRSPSVRSRRGSGRDLPRRRAASGASPRPRRARRAGRAGARRPRCERADDGRARRARPPRGRRGPRLPAADPRRQHLVRLLGRDARRVDPGRARRDRRRRARGQRPDRRALPAARRPQCCRASHAPP